LSSRRAGEGQQQAGPSRRRESDSSNHLLLRLVKDSGSKRSPESSKP
jgi:hypothetical protein